MEQMLFLIFSGQVAMPTFIARSLSLEAVVRNSYGLWRWTILLGVLCIGQITRSLLIYNLYLKNSYGSDQVDYQYTFNIIQISWKGHYLCILHWDFCSTLTYFTLIGAINSLYYEMIFHPSEADPKLTQYGANYNLASTSKCGNHIIHELCLIIQVDVPIRNMLWYLCLALCKWFLNI